MRILSPTENKRFNEMVGFVGLSLAVLIALSLLSYSPHDASFNVSAPAAAGRTRNWIGPVGAHTADIFFQFCGFSAFLFPVGMFAVAIRWFRSQQLEAPAAKVIGGILLVASLSAELTLMGMPGVRGALPAGGLLGTLAAQGLRAAFNPLGAFLVSIVILVTAVLLTTSFSFRVVFDWMKKPMSSEGFIGKMIARARDWREEREKARLRKRVEEIKIAGRPAVKQQRVSGRDIAVAEEPELLTEEADPEPNLADQGPEVIQFHEPEVVPPPKKAPAPKIPKGKTSYRLPSTGLLRTAERGEKMDESELKECARAIEQKCAEFGVSGHITQINPGPVVTTFEFKPEAGIKYSRITSLADDLCLALRAESILIERIPGKSTVGIEVPNARRETIALRDVIESPEFNAFGFQAYAAARQGFDRTHSRRRPDADATPADCGCDRDRQERFHQFPADGHAL